MIITDTRMTEDAIIRIYKCSIKKIDDELKDKAKKSINFIIKCFQLINIFTKEDHAKIVGQIYFSKNNIRTIGVERMSDKVHMHSNTLYSYRQKYCKIIDAILDFIDKNNILNHYFIA